MMQYTGKRPCNGSRAWAVENRMVLDQVAVDEKSNEMTAIPELLKLLDLEGCLVTIDAMGTQRAITAQIIEHWDGTTWSIIPSRSIPFPQFNGFTTVGAISVNDVWAVGTANFDGGRIGQTLIEHWDGGSWSVIPTPDTGGALMGMVAISANNLWAVGTIAKNGIPHTFIEHWDGGFWSIVPSPNPGWSYNEFFGITAVSAHNLWAVGVYNNGNEDQTLVEHWNVLNGTSWHHVPSEGVGPGNNQLYGVAHVPGTNTVWAVGLGTGNTTLTTFSC